MSAVWGLMELQLSRGRVAIIDDEDAALVAGFKWSFHASGYACRDKGRILLHRVIAGAPDGVEVDHVNGDGLDNRRVNLRQCVHADRKNTKKHKDNVSGFKGVSWHKAAGKWAAKIRNKHLGLFTSKEEAARAYDAAAKILFGEFASLNFPESP